MDGLLGFLFLLFLYGAWQAIKRKWEMWSAAQDVLDFEEEIERQRRKR